MLAIDAKSISKSFKEKGKETKALDRLSLKVGQGQIYGLLGPNGAGKTTLIHILSTLMLPNSGNARVLGFDLLKEPMQIRKRIGVCYGASRFSYNFTAPEILEYYGRMHGIGNGMRKKRIEELMEKLDMKEFSEKKFYMLSTGMKQKVAIAKALINEPELMFFDEPTIGLDVEVAIEIRNLMRGLAKEGKTILLTSHNMYEVEALCKRMALIADGKIIKEGEIKRIKKDIHIPDTIWLLLNRYDKLGWLGKIRGVKDFRIIEYGLNINVRKASEIIDDIVHGFEKRGVKVLDVEVRKASLEDAFLKIVGDEHV